MTSPTASLTRRTAVDATIQVYEYEGVRVKASPILGAHMSIAGGYYKAVEAAKKAGCDCVQIFSKNNNQWKGKALVEQDVKLFQDALAQHAIGHPVAHDSYLINLAAPDDVLWQKSIDAFVDELERADRLGVPYVVTHPGSFTTTSEEVGLARIVTALDLVHRRLPQTKSQCLLETTAGQGSNLGWRFEHLQSIINGVEQPERLGVCVDTCHIFAAGYAISDKRDYKTTFAALDKAVGLDRIKAFHLNDSVKGLGCRVDRHAHIGRGSIGLAAFQNLLKDKRFRDVPMYLETPKGLEDEEDLDIINLRVLRVLRGLLN